MHQPGAATSAGAEQTAGAFLVGLVLGIFFPVDLGRVAFVAEGFGGRIVFFEPSGAVGREGAGDGQGFAGTHPSNAFGGSVTGNGGEHGFKELQEVHGVAVSPSRVAM